MEIRRRGHPGSLSKPSGSGVKFQSSHQLAPESLSRRERGLSLGKDVDKLLALTALVGKSQGNRRDSIMPGGESEQNFGVGGEQRGEE